jgi:UDP:flavonoid glycosyltransferase YjiC (YdhE family)
MRVLVASTGGAGHFGPLVPFVQAFARRGDEVLVVVPPSLRESAAATGQRVHVGAEPPADEVAALWQRVPTASREEAAVLVNREVFGRLYTAAMLPTMTEAYRDWRPELVLREPCEFASADVAQRSDVPQAQVGISLAQVGKSSLTVATQALRAGVADRIVDSPYLSRFPASMDPSPFAVTRRFREPDGPIPEHLPDWWDGADGPLVYVTLGSVTGRLPVAATAYRAVLDAVADLPVRALVTVGRSTDVTALGPTPANAHVEAWVPQAEVLPAAAVVVCHGGSGTTFGALAAGVPLVVLPMFADQPANGRLVAQAQAGVLVEPDRAEDTLGSFGPDDVPRVRAAIEGVLGDQAYRKAAIGIADEMRAEPDIDEVVAELVAELATP